MYRKVTDIDDRITDKSVGELLDVWYSAWQTSSRKTLWPRVANDALRAVGSSSRELQDAINALCVKAKRTKEEEMQLRRYFDAKMESEFALVEDVSSNPIGMIFVLKAKYGYEDKQTVKVEGGSLQDIIAKNSSHAPAEGEDG